jgi:hypothetical protein
VGSVSLLQPMMSASMSEPEISAGERSALAPGQEATRLSR